MAKKSGSKIIGAKRTMKQAPKITHGNHTSSGVMSKHPAMKMTGPGRC